MKKILLFVSALAGLFLAASCQQENLEPVAGNGQVTFTVEAPAVIQTKAIANGLNVNELIYEVWITSAADPTNLVGKERLFQGKETMFHEDGKNKAKVTLDLVNDQHYTVLFWAQVKEEGKPAAYITEKLTEVKYAKGVDQYLANDESLAAFYAVNTVNDGVPGSSTVYLKRPFAQVNLCTFNKRDVTNTVDHPGDYNVAIVNSKMTLKKVPTQFNVATSEATEPADFSFVYNVVPSGEDKTIEVNSTKYYYAGMNYVFAGDNLELTYDIQTSLNGSTNYAVVNNVIAEVPVKENHRTNIVGNLLTSKTDYDIIVDAAFNEPAQSASYVTTTEEIDKALKANEEVITVTLGADVSLTANDAYLKLGGADTKQIIIDGKKIATKSGSEDYYTLNLSTTYWSRINTVNPDAKIVLRNLNLTSSQESGTWNSYDVTFQCNVEMENVNVLKAVALDGVEKAAVLKNVTISESHDYYALWIAAAGQTVSLENVTINSLGRGIKIDDQYVGENTKLVTLNVDGLKVKSNNKAAIMVKTPKGAHITLKDVDITEVKADTSNEVWIDEDASSYINMVTVTGGSMIVEGQETVTINSMETLKSELAAAGEAGAGYTVLEISTDIDMTGQEWTPIEVDGYNGADVVTIDGKGHSIKGLTSSLFAGGFAGGSGIVIKNLTIENAKMIATNTQGYGAFVNCADAMDVITLINCHLKNSTITTPNNGQGESRIGGLVGWTAGYGNQNDGPVDSYITIQGCSVTGCTFTGWGSIGGICGHAGANAATFTTIENCIITNNKFISTDDGGWRTGVVVGTANNGQCVIKNITESGNTLTQKNADDIKNPEGAKRNYFGRFVPAGTGSLTIDGYEVEAGYWPYAAGMRINEKAKCYDINAEGLNTLCDLVNAGTAFNGKTIRLTEDVDLNNVEWTPIGNSANQFQGTFDGNNKTISNLVITGNKSDVGLFGMTTNGEIKNLTVNNAKVSGYLDVAVVAGTPYTSKYTNIKVTGHVEVNGFAYVGAVGGKNAYANWTDVTVDVDETSYVNANSVANGTAYRTYVGGVCGFNGEGGHSFKNISSNIDVTGSTIDVGGLFGMAHYGNSFVNCSCSGDVQITAAAEAADAEEIGGIAGVWHNQNGTKVTFDGCSFTGTLKANITEGVNLSDNTIVGKAYSTSGTGELIIK